MESNGPDNTKVRGPAAVVYERYQQYARDAASSGDRVLSENYLQHADHYFRLMRTMQPAAPPPIERFEADAEFSDFQGDEEVARSETPSEGARAGQSEYGGEDAASPSELPRGEGDFRRRRGRRNRFRPGSDSGAEGSAEGPSQDDNVERSGRADRDRPERGDRGERSERRERALRERPETQTQEGFSNGPRPAFLGSD